MTKSFFLLSFMLMIIVSCNNASKSETTDKNIADSLADTHTTTISQTITDTLPEKSVTKQTQTITQDYDYAGVMMLKSDTWIIRVTDDNKSLTDYYPKNLTSKYHVAGMKVQFSGTPEEIPANVRMVGRPITLTAIEEIK